MKKIFCLMLCLLMLTAVFSGCNTQGGETTGQTEAPKLEHVLQVGYARADITPTVSIPLSGLSNSVVGGSAYDRYSEDVKNKLYATCIALTDETGYTILLFHVDQLYAYEAYITPAKMKILRATGVPGPQILVCSTHNHSSPVISSTEGPLQDYIDFMAVQMNQAAIDAMADRKPAEMYISSIDAKGLNCIRHYKMADNTVAGDNFGTFKNNTIVGHYREVDSTMQLIKFTREGGKDVVLMNFQGHPRGHSEYRYSILSDVDEVRKNVEAKLDCHFAYFLGASGNVNSKSRVASENLAATYVEHGVKMGEYAEKAAENFRKVQTGSIKLLYNEYAGTAIANDGTTRPIPMFAFAIGDVGFVTAPYEMFCESGEAIKEGSPFKMTFVSSCSNGSLSYIPSAITFSYGEAYKSYEEKMTQFVPGTAELLVTEYISMLNQLKQPAES